MLSLTAFVRAGLDLVAALAEGALARLVELLEIAVEVVGVAGNLV